jgi:hypothetical protein
LRNGDGVVGFNGDDPIPSQYLCWWNDLPPTMVWGGGRNNIIAGQSVEAIFENPGRLAGIGFHLGNGISTQNPGDTFTKDGDLSPGFQFMPMNF